MQSPLPTFALYGETGASPGLDWLHCESIAERSRLHDWEIRPHRHESLFQILYIRSGRCASTCDGEEAVLRGAAIVTVPALSMHGFAFSPDVQGVVVTVQEQQLQRLLAGQPALAAAVLRLRRHRLERADGQEIGRAVHALRDEYARAAPWRPLAMELALLQLLLLIGRRLPAGEAASAVDERRALIHVRRFRELVERRFRTQPLLSDCARELGITATQLNRVCRQVLGRGALAVLHARLALEAQRELAYTTLSVKQIGLGLGFSDAGYFTRFFQRTTGRAPSAWRAEAAGRARR
ncbi:MAG: helix-turn-helix domain-containing protein [Proteobacteria bacterium]|nr:helix-turn-helix domain-containing protein [Pseudomonadota bacterium]